MISFNNIPNDIRNPGTYVEIDNSRALKGLFPNPHKVLILGQKVITGSVGYKILQAITNDSLADGYFGVGSILARMCNVFKENNPNTELFAMALDNGAAAIAASASLNMSDCLNGDPCTSNGTYYLMVNGVAVNVALTSGMTGLLAASAVQAAVNAISNLPVIAKTDAVNASVYFSAICSGIQGNYINIRDNYQVGQSYPAVFSTAPVIVSMADGAVDPELSDAWAVIDGEQFHYIIQPYTEAANLNEIEGELVDRFKPLEDLQGHGFTVLANSAIASATTLGNSRNSPHNTIMANVRAPNAPEEWAAALGAVASHYLNQDPARPLHFLKLKGVLPPDIVDRQSQAERNILLYDGIATYVVDSGGNVLIERCITTYQENALNIADPSYLDIQTLATLSEIRYQYKSRMATRYIIPRFKLADNSFPVQPGSYVARPMDVKQETIALFTLLRDKGLIENLDDFVTNLVVERNLTDRNRVDVLLPPDLINQFRVLAGLVSFIL